MKPYSCQQRLLGTADLFAPEHKAVENPSGKPMTRIDKRVEQTMQSTIPLLPTLLLMVSGMLSAADLPDWFEVNRVQAHCEMFRLQDETGGLHLHKPIAELGAQAVTLIVDNREEGAWWPSAVGETHPLAANRDVAREIVESVHRNGMKCIGYYRSMSDAWAEREHPEWLCRDAAGQPVGEPRARKARKPVSVLCANSPYREFVKTRLRELAQRGVDMIYFDSWHMPEVCTCQFCRRKFEAETGQPFPLKIADKAAGGTDEISDADGQVSLAKVYSEHDLEVSGFVSRSLVQAFTEWREAAREINPSVRFAIGSSLYPVFLGQPQLTADFLAIADTSKTEFNKPFGGGRAMLRRVNLAGFAPPAFDIQTALGWSLVRDSSGVEDGGRCAARLRGGVFLGVRGQPGGQRHRRRRAFLQQFRPWRTGLARTGGDPALRLGSRPHQRARPQPAAQ